MKLLDEFCRKRSSPEYKVCKHPEYTEATNIIGVTDNSNNTFELNGYATNYSIAVLRLEIRLPGFKTVKTAWESREYELTIDAQNILVAECNRLSTILTNRIECHTYDSDLNKRITEVFNDANRDYALAATNL